MVQYGNVEKQQRVLGMAWDPEKDVFKFTATWRDDLIPYVIGRKRPTKRIALRVIMSLFDPLGLLAPILIHGRMLMQDLWRAKLNWDEEMAEAEFVKWQRWLDLIPLIYKVEIPRCYFGDADSREFKSIQLHIFTDACELGYGCVAYFRAEDNDGVHCSMAMARCKVAPLKHLTIPQMELQAALAGARLLKTVSENHTLSITEKFLHTDSEVVLSWIASPTREYKQFVACGIGEILTLTEPNMWRYHNLEPSSELHQLTPIIDEYGILRIDGRTAHAKHIKYDARFPVILPKEHPVTNLIIDAYHGRLGHANHETIVNEIRQKYYIPHLRVLVGKRARNCQQCKVKKCKPHNPRMAPLPKARMQSYARPFSYVGVDYLGPLDVVNARRTEKRYIAVFTCLVTRAVHLEVAPSLSTESCIMA
uniref:Integrase zinc-binding domain-containing protein n=1 Tax=Anopheles epiroticus TaxID=199890 RepID=A0A182PWW0_9DIPT